MNISAMQATLQQLKAQLAALEPNNNSRQAAGRFELGAPSLDAALGGGLARGALHEIFGNEPADAGTVSGFAAGLAMRAASQRSVVWIRQGMGESESGRLHAPGLAALGFDPAMLVLVRARRSVDVLKAADEALRCPELGAVVLESWGTSRMPDFKASRRLSLAAAGSGVIGLFLRLSAEPHPSVATTRWRVAAAPSRPLAANAPGLAAFDITLLHQRGGRPGGHWRLEWNHELCVFREIPPLSGSVAALSPSRPRAETGARLARAG